MIRDTWTGEADTRVYVALAASFGPADKSVAKAIQATLKPRPFLAGTMALAALGAAGEEAGKAKSDLLKLIGDKDSLGAFLLLLTTRHVLGEIGVPKSGSSRAWRKRSEHDARKTWRGGKGGINLGGVVPRKPASALIFLNELPGFAAKFPASKLSLPEAFEPGANESYFSIGNMLQNMSLHVARGIGELADGLPESKWKSWDGWVTHTEPLVLSAELLREFDRNYIPDTR